MRWFGMMIVALGLALAPAGARAETVEVDLELVLLADSSGSIDDAEIRFQRQGYAQAIQHPQVLAAIGSGLLTEWPGKTDTAKTESVEQPFVFSDSLAQDDSGIELMATGIVFE